MPSKQLIKNCAHNICFTKYSSANLLFCILIFFKMCLICVFGFHYYHVVNAIVVSQNSSSFSFGTIENGIKIVVATCEFEPRILFYLPFNHLFIVGVWVHM